MFGAKAKKIHELKLGMEGFRRQMNEWQNAAAKFQVKAEELEAGLKFVNSANSALLAERDQFAKRVEELEERLAGIQDRGREADTLGDQSI